MLKREKFDGTLALGDTNEMVLDNQAGNSRKKAFN